MNSAYASFVLIVATRPCNRNREKQGFYKRILPRRGALRRRPKRGGDCFIKPVASRNGMKAQTLLYPRPVKKFASDKG